MWIFSTNTFSTITWLVVVSSTISLIKADEKQSCYKLPNDKDKAKCEKGQCFRMKYWIETSIDGKKIEDYPRFFGGCREHLPGQGGPLEFPNDCVDYKISREFLNVFNENDGKVLNQNEDHLDLEKFNAFKADIKAKENEKDTEGNNEYDFKATMCYCKNEFKDGKMVGDPCNAEKATIGVSKSGVATLALTVVLLAMSIMGVWFFVKSCQVDRKSN